MNNLKTFKTEENKGGGGEGETRWKGGKNQDLAPQKVWAEKGGD